MLQLVAAQIEDESDEATGAITEAEEAQRTKRLVRLVDHTLHLLRNEDRLARSQADALVQTTRDGVLDLFPGSDATYNLLVAPRFTSAIEERFGPSPDRQLARVLPFRRPVAADAPEAIVVELAAIGD